MEGGRGSDGRGEVYDNQIARGRGSDGRGFVYDNLLVRGRGEVGVISTEGEEKIVEEKM